MTPPIDPQKAREFATEVVRKLRAAGFEALFAGGCVRDQLLGRTPKDFDVATNARPEQIREVFGHRRTLPIGAAFGVIAVLGPRGAGAVETATFRQDAQYSDGRHPDEVTFSTAEADAQRRDFTINGLFYDPLSDQTIDYVGGIADLEARRVRAIGDAEARLQEDKLRMLRAVRFAATLEFALDEPTRDAIRLCAEQIHTVSAERIGEELRRMLAHPQRAVAVEMLHDCRLLRTLFPELVLALGSSGWEELLAPLRAAQTDSPAVGFALLLRPLVQNSAEAERRGALRLIERIGRQLRLANDELRDILYGLQHEPLVQRAQSSPWPPLQRVLIDPRATALLEIAEAAARSGQGDLSAVTFCRNKRAEPVERWNPEPLIDGGDLQKTLGLKPGPAFRTILDRTRDAQLEGRLADKQQALELAAQIAKTLPSAS